jgi:hypothetical protein
MTKLAKESGPIFSLQARILFFGSALPSTMSSLPITEHIIRFTRIALSRDTMNDIIAVSR